MVNFWSKVKTWFKEEEESSPTKPFIQEWLDRTEEEKGALKSWESSMAAQEIHNLVFEKFQQFKTTGTNSDKTVYFLNSDSSGGFMLYFSEMKYSIQEAKLFMDWLNQKVKEAGYISQIADYRLYTKNNIPKRLERYYLKPKLAPQQNGKAVQLFGNILLELTLSERQPTQLKFQATRYSDSKFNEGQSFGELMETIFK